MAFAGEYPTAKPIPAPIRQPFQQYPYFKLSTKRIHIINNYRIPGTAGSFPAGDNGSQPPALPDGGPAFPVAALGLPMERRTMGHRSSYGIISISRCWLTVCQGTSSSDFKVSAVFCFTLSTLKPLSGICTSIFIKCRLRRVFCSPR